MQNRTDFRTDTEVLVDHLRGLAQDITREITHAERTAETDPQVAQTTLAEIRALAGAQLLMIQRYQAAEAKANADAHESLWTMYQQCGIAMDREKFDRLFPAETNGRLAPPTRTVFPRFAAPAAQVA